MFLLDSKNNQVTLPSAFLYSGLSRRKNARRSLLTSGGPFPLPGVYISIPHLGSARKQRSRHFSMVLLGLQSRLLTLSHQWLHRESQKLRTDESFRRAFSRFSLDTFHPL